jgi:4-hydroxythreonine-4-phosphate dehydrogenase
MPDERPILLVTCGDPAGIGPEVAAAAWLDQASHAAARLRIVAEAGVVEAGLEALGASNPPAVVEIEPDDLRPSGPGELLVIPPAKLPRVNLPGHLTGGPSAREADNAKDDKIEQTVAAPARPTAGGGRAAAEAVLAAVGAVRQGLAAGIVTGPLNKAGLAAAGYDLPGHTELLARSLGLPDAAASMMLWLPPGPGLASADGLGVVHTTLHERLAAAVGHITQDRIEQAGRRLDAMLRRLLGRQPRLAVAAVNPHAGEAGLFGDEEKRIVGPAVHTLASEGLTVSGPHAADTLFVRAAAGVHDGVVAQYHDQGHIPIKLLGMHRAVNITLGLPIVRTSVAHGTAFDIAGRGVADPSSMKSAILAAAKLAAGPQAATITAAEAPRV